MPHHQASGTNYRVNGTATCQFADLQFVGILDINCFDVVDIFTVRKRQSEMHFELTGIPISV